VSRLHRTPKVNFPNPGNRLVWVVSVEGLGEVSVRRGPASEPVKPDPSGAIIYQQVGF